MSAKQPPVQPQPSTPLPPPTGPIIPAEVTASLALSPETASLPMHGAAQTPGTPPSEEFTPGLAGQLSPDNRSQASPITQSPDSPRTATLVNWPAVDVAAPPPGHSPATPAGSPPGPFPGPFNPSHVLSPQTGPAIPTQESLPGLTPSTGAAPRARGDGTDTAAAEVEGATRPLVSRNPFNDSAHIFGTAGVDVSREELLRAPRATGGDPLASAETGDDKLAATGPYVTETEAIGPGHASAPRAVTSQQWSSTDWPFLRPRHVDFPINVREGVTWPASVRDEQTVAFSSQGGAADFQVYYERSLQPLQDGTRTFLAMPLGRGGEGSVYRALQLSLSREVAVKIPKAQPAGHPQRALEEAVVIGHLDHPHIVPIHDVGRDQQGRLFYAMKLVRGKPWRESIAQAGPIQAHSATQTVQTLGEAARLESDLEIFLKVCDAVSFAHSRGILHRDLKPDNVLVGAFGEVYVSDWGAAVALPGSRLPVGLNPRPGFGTWSYMPPEGRGDVDRLDVTLDVYLLGGLLWKLLHGYAPRGEKPGDPTHRPTDKRLLGYYVDTNHVSEPDVERMQRLGTEELVDVARRALAAEPRDRPQTVAELRGAVVRCRTHQASVKAGLRARQTLETARHSSDYAKALAQFEDARASWDDVAVEDSEWRGNPAEGWGATASAQFQKLLAGENETRLRYAAHAEATENFELGLSLLDHGRSDHAPLRERLQQRLQESQRRQSRLTLFRRLALGLLCATALAGAAAGVQYYRAYAAGLDRDAAIEQKTEAQRETRQALQDQATAESETEAARNKAAEAQHSLSKAEQAAAELVIKTRALQQQTEQARHDLEQVEKARRQAEYASLIARFETAFEDGRWKEAVKLRESIVTKGDDLELPVNSVLKAKFRELDQRLDQPAPEPAPLPVPPARPQSRLTPGRCPLPPGTPPTTPRRSVAGQVARRAAHPVPHPRLRPAPLTAVARRPVVIRAAAQRTQPAPGRTPPEDAPQRVAVADRESPAQCLALLARGEFPLLTNEQRSEGYLVHFSPGHRHCVVWKRGGTTVATASRGAEGPVEQPLALDKPFLVADVAFLGDTHLAVLANHLQEFHLEFFPLGPATATSRALRVPLRLSRGAEAASTRIAAAPEPANPTRHRVLVATRPKKAPDLRLLTVETSGADVQIAESLVSDPERDWSIPDAAELLPRHLAITWDWAVLATDERPPVAFRLADLPRPLDQLPVLPVQNLIGSRTFLPGKSPLEIALSPLARPFDPAGQYRQTVALAFSPGAGEWLLTGSRLGARGDEFALGEVALFHVSPAGLRPAAVDRLPAGPAPHALFTTPGPAAGNAVWLAEDRANPRHSRVLQIALAQAGNDDRSSSSRAFDLTRDDDPQLFSYAFGDDETNIVVTGSDPAASPAILNEGSLPPYSLLLPLGTDRFLTTGFDYRPRVWNLKERREEARLDFKPGFTTVGAASDDGSVFALPGDTAVTATVHRRDAGGNWQTTALRLDTPPRPIAAASTLALSADGHWLLTGDRAGQGWVWNLATRQRQRLNLPGATALRASVARGTRAFLGTDSGKLYSVDLAGEPATAVELSSSTPLGKGAVAELDLSPDARQLVQLREERSTRPGSELFVQTLWLADIDAGRPTEGLRWRSLQRSELTRKTVKGTSLPDAGEQLSAVHFISPGWIAALRRRIDGNVVQQCLWQTSGEPPTPAAGLPPYVLNYPAEIGAAPANSRAVHQGSELLSLHGSTIHRWRLGEPGRDLAQPGEATARTFQHLGMFSYNMQVTDLSATPAGDLVLCASPQTGLKAWGITRIEGQPARVTSLGQLPDGEGYRGYQAVQVIPRETGPVQFIAAPSRPLPNTSQVQAQLFSVARSPENGAAGFTLQQTLPQAFTQIESVAVAGGGEWIAVAGTSDGASGRRPRVLVYPRRADGTYDPEQARVLIDSQATTNVPFQGLAFASWQTEDRVVWCLATGDAGDSETARVWAWEAGSEPPAAGQEPIRNCDAPGVGAVHDVTFYRDPNTNRLSLLTCTTRSLRAWDLEIDESAGVNQRATDLTSNSLNDRIPPGSGDLLRMRAVPAKTDTSWQVFLLSGQRGLLKPLMISRN